MTNRKVAISNILFESNQHMIQVPTDLNEVILWLKENDDKNYTEQQALEAYVRTWLFENVALHYIARFDDQLIVLNKADKQLWSLDALDQHHALYRFIDIVVAPQQNYSLILTDDDIDAAGDDEALAVFDRLRQELAVNITVL